MLQIKGILFIILTNVFKSNKHQNIAMNNDKKKLKTKGTKQCDHFVLKIEKMNGIKVERV